MEEVMDSNQEIFLLQFAKAQEINRNEDQVFISLCKCVGHI